MDFMVNTFERKDRRGSGIKSYYSLDRAAAYGAKMVCAREHDAINFRTIVTFRFVYRAFEGADAPGIFFFREQRLFVRQLFTKERFHLSFGTFVLADLCATFLNLSRVGFEGFFVPRSGNRRVGSDQVAPLQCGTRILRVIYVAHGRDARATQKRSRVGL